MKLYLNYFVLTTLLITLLSCSGNKSSANFEENAVMFDMASIEAPPPPPSDQKILYSIPPSNSLINQIVVDKKKIIKDGYIKIEGENINESKKKLEIIIKKYNGYISNESFNDEYGATNYEVKIRIPSDNFDAVISAIESGTKSIVSKSVSARDVTEEYIDLETRLKNKKNYLLKYNELLKQAKSVEDILKIEENTRAIEEEIESTEGRLKYLNDQVSYSTLNVTFFLKSEYVEKPFFKGSFFERLGQSFVSGMYGFIEFVIVLFRLWPIWVIAILIFVIIRRFIKKRRNRKKASGNSKS